MDIKLPDTSTLKNAIGDFGNRIGFPPSFLAYLGKGDGVTITDPDYPFVGANQYVWYHTESGRQGHARLAGPGTSSLSYINDAAYHGMPVQIGRLPEAYNISGEVVLGLGGEGGLAAAGGGSVVNTIINNNYITNLDRMGNLRCTVQNAFVIAVAGKFVYAHPNTGTLQVFGGGTVDLASIQSALTAGQQNIAMVYLDPYTNTVSAAAGTARVPYGTLPTRGEVTAADLNTPSLLNRIRITPIYLYYGQTGLVEDDILRTLDERVVFIPPEIVRKRGGDVRTGISGAYAASEKDGYLGVQGGATITLPQASKVGIGNAIYIKNDDNTAGTSTVTINTYAGDTFGSGLTTASLSSNAEGKIYVVVAATQWLLVAGYRNKMTGDTGSGGQGGTVPAPGAGDAAAGKYLDASGAWSVPTGSATPTGAVILAPGSSTRNLIQPTGDFIALRIKEYAAQSAAPFYIEDSSGNGLVVIQAGGNLILDYHDAATTGAPSVIEAAHDTSSTPAATFGSAIKLTAQSTTTINQAQARIRSEWVDPTHASRTAKLVLSAYNVGSETDGLEIGPTGIVKITNGVLDMNTHRINNVVNPSAAQDAATKNYVDTHHLAATLIDMKRLGSSTYSTLDDVQTLFHSAGWTSGGAVTDAGAGKVNVAAGTGLFRSSAASTADLYFGDWSAVSNVTLTDEAENWIIVSYNAGTPAVTASASEPDYFTAWPLARVFRHGTVLHIFSALRHTVGDHASLMQLSMENTMPFANVSGGRISATGTRNFAITAGVWWHGLTGFTTAAFDSSGAGTFESLYRDGVGGWNRTTGLTQVDNLHYDNGTGTLATLSNNKYAVMWVYLAADNDVSVQYGQGDYTLIQAQAAQPPTPALELQNDSRLIGRIIIQKSAAAFAEIDSALDTVFHNEPNTDHNSLSGLQGGTTGEYYHLTSAEATLLTGTKTANTVLAGPTSGGAATATYRALVAADIPNLDAAKITSGVLALIDHGSVVNATAASVAWLIQGASSQSGDLLQTQDSSANVLSEILSDGRVVSRVLDAGTTNIAIVQQIVHASSGTPAAGFGTNALWLAHSANNTQRNQFQIATSWIVATDASRTARAQFSAFDSGGAREGFRIEGSGTAAMISFFGGGAAVKQTVTGAKGGNAALGSLLTALANYGLITDSSSA